MAGSEAFGGFVPDCRWPVEGAVRMARGSEWNWRDDLLRLSGAIGRGSGAALTCLPVQWVLADDSWLSRYGDQSVRVVEYALVKAPDETHRLLTTFLDPEDAPAAGLVGPCHERWEIETVYDESRTHMLGPRPSLRSKTPDLVRQEVEGLMPACQAVHTFLAEAVGDEGLDPDDLSFVHAIRVVCRRLLNPGPRRRPPLGPVPGNLGGAGRLEPRPVLPSRGEAHDRQPSHSVVRFPGPPAPCLIMS